MRFNNGQITACKDSVVKKTKQELKQELIFMKSILKKKKKIMHSLNIMLGSYEYNRDHTVQAIGDTFIYISNIKEDIKDLKKKIKEYK